MPIHQFIPYLHAPGDAAADQVYAFQRAFREWGHESEVFALEGDASVADRWHPAAPYLAAARPDAIHLYHYVIGSPLTALLRQAAGRMVLYYHNLTPAHFVAPYHRALAASLQAGRDELATLCDVPALAPSEYSCQELRALGFRRVQIAPLIVDTQRLHRSAQSPAGRAIVTRYNDGAVNWVSVGRVAPNKCCEDILKAFAYYQRLIAPHSRLFLVGGIKHFEAYQFNLARLSEHWQLRDVHWLDRVDDADGFGAYYALASVLVEMSAHEGFCAPLLEAMSFDVPIIAYAAAAVPETLGNAGVQITAKRPDTLAGLVEALQHDGLLRSRIITTQRERLAAFATERVLAQLRAALMQLTQGA